MAFQVALSRALARESRDSREGENSVSAKLIPTVSLRVSLPLTFN